MTVPACIANLISMGAVWDANVGSQTVAGCTDSTTAADQVTCFSNSNSSTDLFAPGGRIMSSSIGGGVSVLSGTSQAVPMASACAALMIEADPTLTPDDIEADLEALRIHRGTPGWILPLVPMAGALLTGVLVHFFAAEARGHGVPEVMDSLFRRKAVIRPRVALVKSITSVTTIGSGGSAGADGPIVQIGSAIGANIAHAPQGNQPFSLLRRLKRIGYR